MTQNSYKKAEKNTWGYFLWQSQSRGKFTALVEATWKCFGHENENLKLNITKSITDQISTVLK